MNEPLSLFQEPLARSGDPSTSHEAAAVARRGNAELLDEIAASVFRHWEPVTAFEIAEDVEWHHQGRWDEATIRTAVSRAKKAGVLRVVDECGVSPRGRAATRYSL